MLAQELKAEITWNAEQSKNMFAYGGDVPEYIERAKHLALVHARLIARVCLPEI